MMSTPSRFRPSSKILAPGSFNVPSYRLCIGRVLGGGRLARLDARLRRAEVRDRDHERRARHVRHAHLVTELHGRRLAAMLAADADLEIRTRAPPALDADLDQLADAFLVEDRERIVAQQAFLQI